MLKILLDDFHLNANSKDRKGRTPLFWAAARAQSDAVRLLLHDEYQVDPSARDHLGRTPLSWAAGNTSYDSLGAGKILDTVRIFLERDDVDPDSKDAVGRTPLAWAVYAGCKPVVELLLGTGRIDLSRRFDGHGLVAWAFYFRLYAIVELLTERGVPNGNIKEKLRGIGQAYRFNPNFWWDDLPEVGGPSEYPPASALVPQRQWRFRSGFAIVIG
jgi:ankyrin repeat protein